MPNTLQDTKVIKIKMSRDFPGIKTYHHPSLREIGFNAVSTMREIKVGYNGGIVGGALTGA